MAGHNAEQLMNSHPLQMDNLVLTLYAYLQHRCSHGDSAAVFMPDTIVYRHRSLEGWYFSSKLDGGRVRRKNRGSVSTQAIEEHFISHTDEALDVVACYIEVPDAVVMGDEEAGTTTVEYFSAQQLREWRTRRLQ
jgi:hypothetical protein